MIAKVPSAVLSETEVQNPPPFRLSRTPAASRNAARERGKHTEEILAEYGRSPEEICGLREARVI